MSDRPVRGSGDDLRSSFQHLLRGGLGGPTFVLAVFVYAPAGWVAVARSLHRAKLDALAQQLRPVAHASFRVIEVDCDPEDVEAVEAAVLALPRVDADFDNAIHSPDRPA